MMTILVVTVIALIVFSAWNLLTLREIKAKSKNPDKELNDQKYFELKYKIEFLVAIFTVLVAIGGFLGYNSIQNAKSEIQANLNKEVSLIENRIVKTDKSIRDKDSLVSELMTKLNDIRENTSTTENTFNNQKEKLNALVNTIDVLNKKNIIKQNYYIVSLKRYKYDENDSTKHKYYFKDLKTNLGDNLPIFKTAPIVIPVSESFITILNVNKESFKVGNMGGYSSDTVRINLVIIEK